MTPKEFIQVLWNRYKWNNSWTNSQYDAIQYMLRKAEDYKGEITI